MLRRHVLEGPSWGLARQIRRLVGSIERPPATPGALLFANRNRAVWRPIRQHDVARLQIAVDDACTVRGGKRIRDLNADLQGWSSGNRTFL